MIGVGTDILEIERIREVVARQGEPFACRILTDVELAYCHKHADPIPHIAARFSAKESVSKALGCGIGSKLGWHDMEISHDPSGRPVVRLAPQVAVVFGGPSIALSISHCRAYVSTVAIISYSPDASV